MRLLRSFSKTKGNRMKDLWDQTNEFLVNYDTSALDNDQDNLVLYMELARLLSWDIPSTMPCDHFDREIPMHRDTSRYYRGAKADLQFIDWPVIDDHFSKEHGLDLSDKRINWDFDT